MNEIRLTSTALSHNPANLPGTHDHLHGQALEIVKRYKACEFELIEILQKVDLHKVFYSLGYSSLFKYATLALGLSEEVAYIFISVARKSKEIPLLKAAIKDGTISVSKAKRITSVLNSENQKHWLELAKKSSKRELEKQVAISAPKKAVVEKMSYVHPSEEVAEKAKILSLPEARVQLQVGVSEDLMLKLRRAQDVESQKRQRSVTLEEVLAAMTGLYLEKHDPLKVAKRQKMRGKLQDGARGALQDGTQDNVQSNVHSNVQSNVPSRPPQSRMGAEQCPGTKRREPLTAGLRHKLSLKYQGQCAHVDPNGRRCSGRRFLHTHHIQPVHQGGQNELFNLQVLCSGHHRAFHHA